MKTPPKALAIPALVRGESASGAAGSFMSPEKIARNRSVVEDVLRDQFGKTDERIQQIMRRGEKAGIVRRSGKQLDVRVPSGVVTRHEVIHSHQWQKRGEPATKARVFADEAEAYIKAWFSKAGKRSGLSLPQKLSQITSGTADSSRRTIAAKGIKRLF